jgi:uncharacterized protein with ATP-grasp and redox domains
VVCILNQILRVSDHLKLDEVKKDTIFQQALKKATEIPMVNMTSPEFSEILYDIVTEISGDPDPYKTLRREQNQMVMEKIDLFRTKIKESADPLLTAGYYALLGNIIDYGGVRIFNTDEIFNQSERINITVNDYPVFKKGLKEARQVLILADNAGEAVFDKLFIEEIKNFNPSLEVYYGVRSKPAINDVIKEDAEFIGIDQVAQVIETGATCAGIILAETTDAFKQVYSKSDIIISKGQGNFETLENEPEDIFFILKIKCDIVANYTSLKLGSLVFAYKSTIKSFMGLTRQA